MIYTYAHIHTHRHKDKYIYNGILFSYKKGKIRSFVDMWIDLESVIQSEVSQKEKNKYCLLMHTCRI